MSLIAPAWSSKVQTIMVFLLLIVMMFLVEHASAKKRRRQRSHRGKGGVPRAEKVLKMKTLHESYGQALKKQQNEHGGEQAPPISVSLTAKDKHIFHHEAAENDAEPQTIGVVKSIFPTIGKLQGDDGFVSGTAFLNDNDEEGVLWSVTISSLGAHSLRLHFRNVILPPQVELVVVGPVHQRQADGPYDQRTMKQQKGDVWTRSLLGDAQTIVLRHTDTRTGPTMSKKKQDLIKDISIQITEIAHIRRTLPKEAGLRKGRQLQSDTWPCVSNPRCFIDPQCKLDDNYANNSTTTTTTTTAPLHATIRKAMAAVARMEWIEQGVVRTCTGALIADNDPSTDEPLMLSARHCMARSSSNLETYFSYATDTCHGLCPDRAYSDTDITFRTFPTADTVGITMLRSNLNMDYALFRLHESQLGGIPAGAVFLGWDSRPVAASMNAASKLFRISNPNFGPQVYTEYTLDRSQFDTTQGTQQPCNLPRGPYIFSKTAMGGTVGGSSGAPLLSEHGTIVGQLAGKCLDRASSSSTSSNGLRDPCDPTSHITVDGAFASYFSELKDILITNATTAGRRICNSNDDCNNDGQVNPCMTAFCAQDGRCDVRNNIDASTCDDGDPCTTGEQCREGVCQDGVYVCSEVCSLHDRCNPKNKEGGGGDNKKAGGKCSKKKCD